MGAGTSLRAPVEFCQPVTPVRAGVSPAATAAVGRRGRVIPPAPPNLPRRAGPDIRHRFAGLRHDPGKRATINAGGFTGCPGRPMLWVVSRPDEQEDRSQLVDAEMIFAVSFPVAERRGRLSRSRRHAAVAAAVAAVAGAALVTLLLRFL